MTQLMPAEIIEKKIYLIREKRVMLDRDIANLYEVSTKNLNKAVKRNISRFPSDSMFKLTKKESDELSRFQFGTLKKGENIKYYPYVFTENGIAMLSSILRSERAVSVNIQIMRTFTKLREILASNDHLRMKIAELGKKYDSQFKVVFQVIKRLIETPKKDVGKIGFVKK